LSDGWSSRESDPIDRYDEDAADSDEDDDIAYSSLLVPRNDSIRCIPLL
jgi:hypothetical protein